MGTVPAKRGPLAPMLSHLELGVESQLKISEANKPLQLVLSESLHCLSIENAGGGGGGGL